MGSWSHQPAVNLQQLHKEPEFGHWQQWSKSPTIINLRHGLKVLTERLWSSSVRNCGGIWGETTNRRRLWALITGSICWCHSKKFSSSSFSEIWWENVAEKMLKSRKKNHFHAEDATVMELHGSDLCAWIRQLWYHVNRNWTCLFMKMR